MRDVYDFAKFFIKSGADSTPNTYDGNMKLQKMLVLSDMAHLARCRQPLFGDNILAFENGLVVEKFDSDTGMIILVLKQTAKDLIRILMKRSMKH